MESIVTVLAEIRLFLHGDKKYISALNAIDRYEGFESRLEIIMLNEMRNVTPETEKYYVALINKIEKNQTLKIALDLYMGQYDRQRLYRGCESFLSQELYFYDVNRSIDLANYALAQILFDRGVENLIERMVERMKHMGEEI